MDESIEIQSSGFAILLGALMLALVVIGVICILLIQDFVTGEIIKFEQIMWFVLFTIGAVFVFVIRPALIAYFARVELNLEIGICLTGQGIIYELPASEALSGRTSTFVLRRAFARTRPDPENLYQIDRVEIHQSKIGSRFGYGTLILCHDDSTMCVDFVIGVESVAADLRGMTSMAHTR